MTNKERATYSGQKVSMTIRMSPKRRAILEEAARRQEKTLTQVVEEAIDMYVLPMVNR